jgi:hypothetical protein
MLLLYNKLKTIFLTQFEGKPCPLVFIQFLTWLLDSGPL